MQHKAVYLLFCKFTLHVSGVKHTHLRSTQNCNYSLRYRSYFLCSYLPPKWPREVAAQKNMTSNGGCSYSFVYSWWWVWLTPETCTGNLQNNKQTALCCISWAIINIICDVAKIYTFELMHCFGPLILCLTKTYGVFKTICWSSNMPQHYVTLKRGAWFSLSAVLGHCAMLQAVTIVSDNILWVEVPDDAVTSLTTRRHNLGYFIYKERLVLPEMKPWSSSHCTDCLALY